MAVNYDFSESKTELFVKILENLSNESENSHGDDLDDFLNIFNTKIGEFFKARPAKNILTKLACQSMDNRRSYHIHE